MSFRVLCTGDIHIGRRSSKTTETYRSADVWLKIVDLAIAERVDLVAISGDVIDKESKSYEAIGPLMTGLDRLATAGIDTVAVSGNHDHDIMFQISEVAGTDRFRILGKHGRWESSAYRNAEGTEVLVFGWSFPREYVLTSPILDFPVTNSDGRPALALVHGEVGVPQSRYAPVSLGDLWARPIDFWLLGHIHAPATFAGPTGSVALYPGSPLAMDPGEPGPHGVWIAEIASPQPVRITNRAISPVHYTRTEIDASYVSDESDFMTALTMSMKAVGRAAESAHEPGSLREVSCRINLIGRNRLYRQIDSWIERAQRDLGPIQISSTATIQIDRIEPQVRPAIDLEEIARSNDLAGEAARLILAIDQDAESPAQSALINDLATQSDRVHQQASYATIAVLDDESDSSSDAVVDLRQLVREQAWQVLTELVAQKEPA